MKLLAWTLLILLLNVSQAKTLCPTVVIDSEEELEFTETEENLICGDEKNSGYERIPSYQASYFLTSFLQARGFLLPQFEVRQGVLHVDTGKRNFLKRLSVDLSDEKIKHKLKKDLKRRYRHEPLNPSLLNSIESRSETILQEDGYPCADSKTTVDAQESAVNVLVTEGKYSLFGEVSRERIEGLRENALERYYPYKSTDEYNKKLLKLNEKRLLRADVLQGTYYLNNCSEHMDQLKLEQHFILGPPRTVRFGVGASTELGPKVRFRWSNNRYKSMASLLSANMQASFRSQSLNLSADSFLWKNRPRQSLLSQLELLRESQLDFEQSLARVSSHVKWTHDQQGYYQVYTLGPTLETGTYHVESDTNTKSYSNLSMIGGMQWISHSYEFFDLHPQEGSAFGFDFDFRHPSLGFKEPMLKLNSTYVGIQELTFWGKGALIGAMRVNASTTWVSDEVSLNALPPSVKFYAGGSDDIRGYLLNTLPKNNGLGAFSKLGLKLELRRTNVVKESIEVFSFVDNAFLGESRWHLDKRLWYSPGLGLRWLSPIGLVQGYVSRALATSPNEDFGNFYYAGIGGTF